MNITCTAFTWCTTRSTASTQRIPSRLEFDRHDRRYERTAEWLRVVNGMWSDTPFGFHGEFYQVQDAILEPKPLRDPRPTIYAGGESEAAKRLISRACDGYLMHGDPPERVAGKIAEMRRRRAASAEDAPPMLFGVAGYVICRDTPEGAEAERRRITDVRANARGYRNYQDWIANTQLEQQVSLDDYSVSNRGLRSGLVGTPEQLLRRLREFEAVGVDLVLLQFSPQLEEMERFAEGVIARYDSAGVSV